MQQSGKDSIYNELKKEDDAHNKKEIKQIANQLNGIYLNCAHRWESIFVFITQACAQRGIYTLISVSSSTISASIVRKKSPGSFV